MPLEAANADVAVHLLSCDEGFFQAVFADGFPDEAQIKRLTAIHLSGILGCDPSSSAQAPNHDSRPQKHGATDSTTVTTSAHGSIGDAVSPPDSVTTSAHGSIGSAYGGGASLSRPVSAPDSVEPSVHGSIGDNSSSESETGDAVSDESETGDAVSDESETGDAVSDESETGDAVSDESESDVGDATGDPVSGPDSNVLSVVEQKPGAGTVSYLKTAHKEAESKIVSVSFPGLTDLLRDLHECGTVLLTKKTRFWTHVKGDPKRLMFHVDYHQGTNAAAEGKAFTLTQSLLNYLIPWHGYLYSMLNITDPLLKYYFCFLAAAPGYTQAELECQQFHKDSEHDGTLNVLIALEDNYKVDFVIGGQIRRLSLKFGEAVYFANSYHRGVDAMGLRFHIRIESHSRGKGKETDLGAPLTFLMMDEEAKLLEQTPVLPLRKPLVTVGCKSSFDDENGILEFFNEQVHVGVSLRYLRGDVLI